MLIKKSKKEKKIYCRRYRIKWKGLQGCKEIICQRIKAKVAKTKTQRENVSISTEQIIHGQRREILPGTKQREKADPEAKRF